MVRLRLQIRSSAPKISRYTLLLSTIRLGESNFNISRNWVSIVKGWLLLYEILSLPLRLYDVAKRAYCTARCTLALLMTMYAPFSIKFRFQVYMQSPIAFKSNVGCGVAHKNVVLVKKVWWIRQFPLFWRANCWIQSFSAGIFVAHLLATCWLTSCCIVYTLLVFSCSSRCSLIAVTLHCGCIILYITQIVQFYFKQSKPLESCSIVCRPTM